MAEHRISRLTDEDLGDVVGVLARSREGLADERPPSVDEMRMYTVGDSEFRPEGGWVVRVEGEAVAYAVAIVEASRLEVGFDDAFFEFEVVPEERGKGLEEELVRLGSDYIRSRGVGKIRTRCMVAEAWRESILRSLGFEETYRVYLLVRHGRDAIEEVRLPDAYRIVRRPEKECGDEELTRIVHAFNDSFKGHVGTSPERPERFIKYRDVCQDPEVYSLAMSGDEIAGICLSQESRVFNEANGTKSGWIVILGVRPPHRGKGLGRCLLADGMRWLSEQGLDTMRIGVYAKNEMALRLYKSVGFESDRESSWLEKSLS